MGSARASGRLLGPLVRSQLARSCRSRLRRRESSRLITSGVLPQCDYVHNNVRNGVIDPLSLNMTYAQREKERIEGSEDGNNSIGLKVN